MKPIIVMALLVLAAHATQDPRIKKQEQVADFNRKITEKGTKNYLDRWEKKAEQPEKETNIDTPKEEKSPLKSYLRDTKPSDAKQR